MSTVTNLLDGPAPWMRSPGGHDGVVVSSRVRLARNLAGQPFRRRLTGPDREHLVADLLPRLQRATGWSDGVVTSMDDCNQSERLALVERHLASAELAGGGSQSGIVIRADGMASIMVNEEDHLRLQVLAPDLDIGPCLDAAVALDRALESEFTWAVHPRYGYLTSCPTNLGTGLRASVMVHLPALAESKELSRTLRALGKLHMTARGLNGEGSEAQGHFYQISNQRTLGMTEQAITDQLKAVVADLVAYERLARETLLSCQPLRVEDRVWRAWGICTNARRLGQDELIDQLSWLRWGVAEGMLDLPWSALDRLLIGAQRAHLQLLHPEALDATVRDEIRAQITREALLPPP